MKQSIKPCKLNESVAAITNTRCVYLLTCVWVFYFLKVQKFNLSLTLALNTKGFRRRVGLVSSPFKILILLMACSWNLHQRYFFKNKSAYLWKKIFISRYDMFIFIYRCWSVNSAWLTLFICSKDTRGDSGFFWFQNVANYI